MVQGVSHSYRRIMQRSDLPGNDKTEVFQPDYHTSAQQVIHGCRHGKFTEKITHYQDVDSSG